MFLSFDLKKCWSVWLELRHFSFSRSETVISFVIRLNKYCMKKQRFCIQSRKTCKFKPLSLYVKLTLHRKCKIHLTWVHLLVDPQLGIDVIPQ